MCQNYCIIQCVCVLFARKKKENEKERWEERKLYKKNGNLTISVCNEAGGSLGAKVSGALWVVGVRLCGIGKVMERKKALKFEGKKKKSKESRGSDKQAA